MLQLTFTRRSGQNCFIGTERSKTQVCTRCAPIEWIKGMNAKRPFLSWQFGWALLWNNSPPGYLPLPLSDMHPVRASPEDSKSEGSASLGTSWKQRQALILIRSETKFLQNGVFQSSDQVESIIDPYHAYVFCNLESSSYASNAKPWPFIDLSLQLVRFHMFRCAFRPFTSFHITRFAGSTRHFHRVTTDFITHDVRGHLVTRKVPVIIGNPGETYVLIDQGVGSALRAASPCTSDSAASAEGRCKLTFFHDSQHFGFGKLSLYECSIQRMLTLCLNARSIKLSPPLYPSPDPSPNRVKCKPRNLVLERKDVRDSSRWNS